MRRLALLVAFLVVAAATPARAASPFDAVSVEPGPDGPSVAAEEQEKVAEIQALVAAKKYAEAIDAGKAYLRVAKDEGMKVEATRLVATALRKKGDWLRAAGAYVKLRDRHERGSDEYVRYDAIAEVLRASPTGVYMGGANAAGHSVDPKPDETVANDDALTEALARLAAQRIEKLKVRVMLLRRARTAQDVIKLFLPLAEELRRARILSKDLPADLERGAAQSAGMRLAAVGKQISAALTSKQAEFETASKAKRLTMSLRREMLQCQALCSDMVKTEESFQEGMGKMAGTVEWTEGAQLKTDSIARHDEYEKLAKTFEPPKMGGRGGDAGDWRDSGWIERGGGFGGGGGGL